MLKVYGGIGIDEAGRGPLAGPVVSAAINIESIPKNLYEQINDSKKLTENKRNYIYGYLKEFAGVGISSVQEIDDLNILNAAMLSMKRAYDALSLKQESTDVFIDGNKSPITNAKCVIKGDSLSIEIAAASIVAKVTRDKIMVDLDELYPLYNFKKNKGYGTKDHKKAISDFGLTIHHRKSFKIKF